MIFTKIACYVIFRKLHSPAFKLLKGTDSNEAAQLVAQIKKEEYVTFYQALTNNPSSRVISHATSEVIASFFFENVVERSF